MDHGMEAGEPTQESNPQGGESDANARHFAMKEAWKNQPGNRYTPEQLREPGQLGDWKWAGPKEVFIWPCP
jgi:hypothetical protein